MFKSFFPACFACKRVLNKDPYAFANILKLLGLEQNYQIIIAITTTEQHWVTKLSHHLQNLNGRFSNKKYVFKYIKINKIGGMLRSFFQLALPARGFSIRILLFGQMDLYHPKYICKYTKTSRIGAKLPDHHSKYNSRATLSKKK